MLLLYKKYKFMCEKYQPSHHTFNSHAAFLVKLKKNINIMTIIVYNCHHKDKKHLIKYKFHLFVILLGSLF